MMQAPPIKPKKTSAKSDFMKKSATTTPIRRIVRIERTFPVASC
jgi:hypothetical protein